MKNLFSGKMLESIERNGVIAVLVVDDAADATPLAETLLAAGIKIMELTLRTPAALDALKLIRKNLPAMSAGIGTILTPAQADAALAAGAEFGVAPGMSHRVVARAKEIGLPFAPGVCTPSDIEAALEHGCQLLKFFPAETTGGLKHLKTMAAPYQHLGLKFIPLGGLSQANMSSYLESPLVTAIGGSWIAPRELIKNKDWAAIAENARAAAAAVAKLRHG